MFDLIDYIEDRGYFVKYNSDPLYIPEGYRELRILKYLHRGNPDRERVFQYNIVVQRAMEEEALRTLVNMCLYKLDQTITQYRLIDSTY